MLQFAIPSKGEMEEPTLRFLESCGLSVERPNVRQYTAAIPALPNLVVLFQRAADIPAKVEEGSADLGITGLDNVSEHCREGGDVIVVLDDLGYSHCELVIAVPDSWVDISSMADLADLALEMREQGHELRVATKYPRLTQQFFFGQGLNYFSLVESSGAMEVAPTMGYADIIADLTSSGVTLRENRLKILGGGVILKSQACLIGNRRRLAGTPTRLETTRLVLEFTEARLRARGFYHVTANIRGESPEAVAEYVERRPEIAGLQGPTIARVHSRFGDTQDWYAATVVVRRDKVLAAVDHLRQIGGSSVTVSGVNYVFESECQAYRKLVSQLEISGD